MFGLIPIVITILLAAVVVGAMMYFGGDIFGSSAEDAQATRVINEGEQITGAIKMYRFAEFKSPSDLETDILNNTKYYKGGSDTSTKWVSTPPDGLEGIAATVENTNVCEKVNEEMGYTASVPTCTAVPAELASAKYYCCSSTAP